MKKFLSVAVAVALLFTVSCSSSGNNSTSPKNDPIRFEDVTPPPEFPDIDLDAMQDNLDKLGSGLKDLLEEIESEHTYVITYTIDLEYNNSVGNEWEYGVRYNDEYIASESKIVIANSPTEIEIVAFVTELDDWNDYGTTLVTFDVLKVGQKQTKRATVIVRENEGRFTGNTAEWSFEITIERI